MDAKILPLTDEMTDSKMTPNLKISATRGDRSSSRDLSVVVKNRAETTKTHGQDRTQLTLNIFAVSMIDIRKCTMATSTIRRVRWLTVVILTSS
jgi:hypothetical protein